MLENKIDIQEYINSRLDNGGGSDEEVACFEKQATSPIFILCPARSGSTLLRVMLAGSSELFAPPELELLSFSNLQERHVSLSLRLEHMLNGLIRAIMSLRDCSAEEAKLFLKSYEEKETTVPAFYTALQQWCGSRRLVDKSVHYAMSTKILERAEQYFNNAVYIHLSRHPLGTINSIERLELHKDLFGSIKGFTPRELAESTWQLCHQNILSFLENVPEERQVHLRFEGLVTEPEAELRRLCDFLQIPFQDTMLKPYEDKDQRMTDGVNGAKMIGDPNFNEHSTINAQAAEIPLEKQQQFSLKESSRVVARKLKYLDIPQLKIEEVSPVTDEELQLMESQYTIREDIPLDKTIVALFEKQVEKTPDNIAIVFEDKKLTYRQLNEKANQLAHYLKTHHNIQPEDIIALQLERSPWMIIAIIGVMKAGGAYLPIAPGIAHKRASFMLEDSQTKILLTDEVTSKAAEKLKDQVTILIVEKLRHPSKTNPASITTCKNLAYVIYTSGSTGKPKGVMLEQSGSINFIWNKLYILDISDTDTILQFANYTFDASIAEIFLALFSGATLMLISTETIREPTAFLKAINENKVSVLTLPPAFLSDLNQPDINARVLLTAGENPVYKDVQYYCSRLRYFNAYGPTECSIGVTCHEVSQPVSVSVPIGKPVPNVRIYVLDEQGQKVPVGTVGELHISGINLARGYLNRPKLTAEQFVPNPFLKDERLYKTGDLGRWLADGNIEFLGRKDRQLKIRGYRVEVEEIEKILSEHPAVSSAIITAYKSTKNNYTDLVAYLVPKPDKELPGTTTLRNFLSETLPDYMLPAYFIALDHFPLNSNGKVDHKLLPPPVSANLLKRKSFVAPRNTVETMLGKIWEEVLEQNNIGMDDNFFDLGGHSLRAIQIGIKMTETFHMEIPAKLVFECPTIATLATKVGEFKYGDYHYEEGIVFNPDGKKTLFVFPIVFGLGIDYKPLAELFPDIRWYCFDFLVPEHRLELYYQQIKKEQPNGPYVFYGESVGGSLAFEMTKFMESKGEVISDIILGDTIIRLVHKGFDFKAYLDDFFAHWTDTPLGKQLLLLIQNEMFYKNTEARLTGYNDFVNEVSMEPLVQANIHFLLAKDDDGQDKSKISRDWSGQTTGKYFSYLMPGSHGVIFEPPHLEENVIVMKKILESIYTKKLVF